MVKSTIYLNRSIGAIQVGKVIEIHLDGDHVLNLTDASLEHFSINEIADYVFEVEGFLRTRRPGHPIPSIHPYLTFAKGA